MRVPMLQSKRLSSSNQSGLIEGLGTTMKQPRILVVDDEVQQAQLRAAPNPRPKRTASSDLHLAYNNRED